MSWLHLAKMPGLDGREAWLVVPGAQDRILSWAIGQIAGVRQLPSFGGWLVPLEGENLLFSAIAASCGTGTICQECLHGGPCDDWIRIVSRRFETAKQNALAIARTTGPGWRAPGYHPVEDRRRASAYEETRAYEPPPRPRRKRPDPVILRESKEQLAAKVLGLTWPATKSDVTKAFRKAAMKSHPDLGGTDAAMREVNAARETLLEAIGN